jgi:hypothetical protein
VELDVQRLGTRIEQRIAGNRAGVGGGGGVHEDVAEVRSLKGSSMREPSEGAADDARGL